MLLYETETKEMIFDNIEERDEVMRMYESMGWEILDTSTSHFPLFNAKGKLTTLTRYYLTVSRHLNLLKMKG